MKQGSPSETLRSCRAAKMRPFESATHHALADIPLGYQLEVVIVGARTAAALKQGFGGSGLAAEPGHSSSDGCSEQNRTHLGDCLCECSKMYTLLRVAAIDRAETRHLREILATKPFHAGGVVRRDRGLSTRNVGAAQLDVMVGVWRRSIDSFVTSFLVELLRQDPRERHTHLRLV
jgi:hypothetical protein